MEEMTISLVVFLLVLIFKKRTLAYLPLLLLFLADSWMMALLTSIIVIELTSRYKKKILKQLKPVSIASVILSLGFVYLTAKNPSWYIAITTALSLACSLFLMMLIRTRRTR